MSRKSFKYRIYLSNGQRRILEQQLEVSRWVYNETLAERKRAYEERGESLRLYDTQALLPVWKLTKPDLKRVHSQVLQNISVRVDLAFQAFFRQVKAGDPEPGDPRFKGFDRYDSMTYPQYGNGVRLEGERLILSKVGAVPVVLHRPVEGTPKTVTLMRSRTGKWFACFSCETEAVPLPPTGEVVGVDVGLSSFATLSDGGQKADDHRQSGRSWAAGDSGEPQKHDQDVFVLHEDRPQGGARACPYLPPLRAGDGQGCERGAQHSATGTPFASTMTLWDGAASP